MWNEKNVDLDASGQNYHPNLDGRWVWTCNKILWGPMVASMLKLQLKPIHKTYLLHVLKTNMTMTKMALRKILKYKSNRLIETPNDFRKCEAQRSGRDLVITYALGQAIKGTLLTKRADNIFCIILYMCCLLMSLTILK